MRTLALLFLGVVVGWAASGVEWSREANGETTPTAKQVGVRPEEGKPTYGQAARSSIEGVSVWVIVDETESSPMLNVFVVNNTGEPIGFLETTYFVGCNVAATATDGKAVKYTALGRSLFSVDDKGGGKYGERLVPAGGTYNWSIAMSKIFTSFAPGEYKLRLEVNYSGKRSQTIEALPFVVAG